jgi:tetratricopeptide (TPR) repeat protein
MAKDPGKRPQRMEEVAAELAAIRARYPPSREITSEAREEDLTQTIVARRPPKVRQSRWREICLAAAILLLAGAATGASRAWSLRCLLAPGWFAGCEMPAEKHVGVTDFRVATDGPDQVLSAGLREYVIGQLSRLARFDATLCVHPVEDRSSFRPVILTLEPELTRNGGTATVDGKLWQSQKNLQLGRMTPVPFGTAAFQDQLGLALTRVLAIPPSRDARRAMAAGSTGLTEAFQSYLTGLGHLALDQLDPAIAAFRKAIAEDPYYASGHAGLAEAYRRKYHQSQENELMKQALDAAGAATALDDQLPEAHVALGRVRVDMEDHDGAIQELRRAVDLTPGNPEVRYDLVYALIAKGNAAEAQAAAEKGVELHPKCWLAQHDLGSFFRTIGRFDRAETHFREVVKLAPKHSVARSNLAATLYDQQKYAEAEREWLEALRLEPSSTAYTNLGQLYIRTNCYAAAERALALATEVARDDFLAYGNLGEAYHLLPEHQVREQGLFAKALKLAQQQRADVPNDAQVVRMVAFYHARLGDKQTALDVIQQAIDLAPENVHTLYRAAFLYEITGERERAMPLMERVLKSGYPARELCTHRDLKGLRDDPRFARVIAGKCAPYESSGGERFRCPEAPFAGGDRGFGRVRQ